VAPSHGIRITNEHAKVRRNVSEELYLEAYAKPRLLQFIPQIL
jgi:hypothetical protein